MQTYKVALLSAICIALVLALAGVFAKLLNSRKALSASLVELQEAQSELMATARKAGMAEIATNVLHNVGNVLNSVNISAGVLLGLVRDSKVQGVFRTVQLLNEHANDIGEYLTRDAKGMLLPGYLDKLAGALTEERQTILAELTELTKRVDHIKDIVATQQSFAGTASVIEPVRIDDLFKEALRINEEMIERHKVTVIQEVAELPMLPIDKGRVLQILINLTRNAAHAMGAGDSMHGATRRLTLSAEQTEPGKLRLSVADEGEGISPENLTRIFSHGFTTSRSGRGFGLHSCALAAKEMGGTLTATSPGVGKGATFILELPIG